MTEPIENLDLLSDMLQIYNTYLLLKDATNNALMEELQRQDKVYLDKISRDLELIKEKLGIKND